MPDIPRCAGIFGCIVRICNRQQIARTAQRGTAVRQCMAPNIGSQELQAMAEPLFDFHRTGSVIPVAEGRSHRKAVAHRLARRAGWLDLLQIRSANRSIESAEIRVRVGVPENHLMRLMVALVTDFDGGTKPHLSLDDEIPLMHQRSVEIRLHAAHRNARVCCERTTWISTRKAARHEIAVQALRLAYAYIGTVAL